MSYVRDVRWHMAYVKYYFKTIKTMLFNRKSGQCSFVSNPLYFWENMHQALTLPKTTEETRKNFLDSHVLWQGLRNNDIYLTQIISRWERHPWWNNIVKKRGAQHGTSVVFCLHSARKGLHQCGQRRCQGRHPWSTEWHRAIWQAGTQGQTALRHTKTINVIHIIILTGKIQVIKTRTSS